MRWDVRHFDFVDSTNRYLLEEAANGAPEGTVAVARHQTQGRGRRGRVWDDRPGASLLFSLLLRPTEVVPYLHTQALGLAVLGATDAVAGVAGSLKWPNDVLLNGRKLAGVLAEASSSGGRVEALVLGCGVNLNWRGGLPEALHPTAISLDEVAGPVDSGTFLREILTLFEQRLAAPETIFDDYRERCATLGQRVRIEQEERVFVGSVEGLSSDGELIVTEDGGQRHVVSVGEVVHVRPAP